MEIGSGCFRRRSIVSWYILEVNMNICIHRYEIFDFECQDLLHRHDCKLTFC